MRIMHINTIGQWSLLGCAALSLLTPAAPAQLQEHSQAYVLSEVTSGSDGQRIEIRIDNDAISARVNGKEIPQDRIRRQDGRVMILDEDGKEMRSLNVFTDDAAAGDGGFHWFFDEEPAAEAPLPVMLGLTMTEPGPALEKHLGLAPGNTTMVTGFYRGLPADKAGLGEYDIIVAIDGEAQADPASIRKVLREKSAGDTLRLAVIQEGKRRELKVTLQAHDAEAMREAEYVGSGLAPRLLERLPGGMRFRMEPHQWRDVLIAPDTDVFRWMPHWEEMQDRLEKRLGEVAEDVQAPGSIQEHLEERLQALHERMAELEEMLEKLLKRTEDRER
jgi:hypothetical protein